MVHVPSGRPKLSNVGRIARTLLSKHIAMPIRTRIGSVKIAVAASRHHGFCRRRWHTKRVGREPLRIDAITRARPCTNAMLINALRYKYMVHFPRKHHTHAILVNRCDKQQPQAQT